MYQLIVVVCSVNVFDNSECFQFRACRYGNDLLCDWWKRQVGQRIVDRAPSKSGDSVNANIYISGTASPRSWYLQTQTHDNGREKTERILQAEEQILEHFEEEPDMSTRRLAAEVRISQFIVQSILKAQGLDPYHVQKVQTLEPGVVNDRLIGPYVLPNRLNAAQYLEFLNNVLEEQLAVKHHIFLD